MPEQTMELTWAIQLLLCLIFHKNVVEMYTEGAWIYLISTDVSQMMERSLTMRECLDQDDLDKTTHYVPHPPSRRSRAVYRGA